jgi:sec-independent protein translocase protein TatB
VLDIAPTELLLCAIVALLVIGPKDLPRAMRTLGQFVSRIRGVGRHFRSGFDEMVRQAEVEEMERAWAKENARIMAEHPPEERHDDHQMLPLDHATASGEATSQSPAADADPAVRARPGPQ